MKILIVGGRSSLGTELARQWESCAQVLTAGHSGCDLEFALGRDEIPALPQGIDLVVNTAAHFGGSAKPADLAASIEVNVVGALRLAQACQQAGVARLVQVSSIFALLPVDSPLQSAYVASKRQADEALLLACAASGLALTIVRPSQFVGVGQTLRRHQPFLATLLDKAAQGQIIELWGSGRAQRNFVHVSDVARAIVQLAERNISGVFACQSPMNHSIAEVARGAIAAFGGRSTMRLLEDKPDPPDNTLPIDPTLHQLLGFVPAVSLQDWLAGEAATWQPAAAQ